LQVAAAVKRQLVWLDNTVDERIKLLIDSFDRGAFRETPFY